MGLRRITVSRELIEHFLVHGTHEFTTDLPPDLRIVDVNYYVHESATQEPTATIELIVASESYSDLGYPHSIAGYAKLPEVSVSFKVQATMDVRLTNLRERVLGWLDEELRHA